MSRRALWREFGAIKTLFRGPGAWAVVLQFWVKLLTPLLEASSHPPFEGRIELLAPVLSTKTNSAFSKAHQLWIKTREKQNYFLVVSSRPTACPFCGMASRGLAFKVTILGQLKGQPDPLAPHRLSQRRNLGTDSQSPLFHSDSRLFKRVLDSLWVFIC